MSQKNGKHPKKGKHAQTPPGPSYTLPVLSYFSAQRNKAKYERGNKEARKTWKQKQKEMKQGHRPQSGTQPSSENQKLSQGVKRPYEGATEKKQPPTKKSKVDATPGLKTEKPKFEEKQKSIRDRMNLSHLVSCPSLLQAKI